MWWFFGALLLIILSVFFYLLFAPFFISINTNTGLFQFRFHRLLVCDLVANEAGLVLNLRIAWWKKKMNLLEPETTTKIVSAEEKKVQKRNKKKKPVSFRKLLRMLTAVIKSFKVKQCYISVDTGNMPLNGILYPLLFLLSRKTGQQIMINFWGEETIIIQLKNSMARIAWALIKTKRKT